MFPFLERLNDEQRAAVTFEGGPLRILAGAGTGKTTTLTSRVAWLVASGVPADRILLLTFTRHAAREMINRTNALLGGGRADAGPRARVVGGTFHSIAHRTLRRNAASLGLPEGFSVIDTSDAADVIDLVRQELGLAGTDGRRFPRKATLLDLYTRSVNTGQPLSNVVADVAPWCADRIEPIAEICRGYVARKRAVGLLDFDDLLLYWRAAATDMSLGPILGGEIDHVCVDEYQDVNALQVDVLRALRSTDDRITVVGDDSQAVYGFRGASPRHLLDVDLVFPTISTIVLERNYRSTQPILDVANAVGADAPDGFMVRLRSAEPVGDRPTLVRCVDEDAQVSAVCDRVLAHREEGIELRNQAVLVRAAHHSDLLELELSRRRIPYVKYGGLRFLEAAHVKDLMCLFRLADNPRDELSWFRVLQLLDGVGPAAARRAVTALGVAQGDPTTDGEVLLRWPLAVDVLPPAARDMADTMARALQHEPGETVTAHAERLRAALVPLVERSYDNPDERLADLDALVAGAEGQARLSDVAADLTLEPPRSTSELAGPPLIDEDWLVISTVHSAKGLEWDVVHMINASDGNFPSDMALGSRDGLEEERRLFYVALTRPRRALHVYHPVRYHHGPRGHDDAHTYGQPSRFVSPSVAACFDDVAVGHDDPLIELAAFDASVVVDLELDALWS